MGRWKRTLPENRAGRLFPLCNELIKWLSSWTLSDKDYEEAENEFFREQKSLKPEVLSQFRHKFLEALCKKARKGGARVAAVIEPESEALAPDLSSLENLEDDEFESFVAEFFADDGAIGQVLAIRERKQLNDKGFRKKSNKTFGRFKKLANKFGNQEPRRQQADGRAAPRAGGGSRKLPRLPPGRTYENTGCKACTNLPVPQFHSLARCPRLNQSVREVKEEREDNAETEAFRSVWGESA